MNTLTPAAHLAATDQSLSEVLQETFGFNTFRPYQNELVSGLIAGRDVFGIMPTGGGKSLCYQLPAVVAEGCAIIISPLIALMKDQVDAASANGIRAACSNSSMPHDERATVNRAYRQGELDLLYLAPERLATGSVLAELGDCPSGAPAFFAIDEAHCISEWGHDFRPDYRALAKLREQFPDTPLAAFTATATQRVAEDIESQLGLRDPVKVRASFDRENLFYDVRAKRDWEAQIVGFIKEHTGQSGIVYRTSRKDVEATAALLRSHNIDAVAYHAGMGPEQRSEVQEMFIRDNAAVIVATVAFGMGIDKSDVRFVVHGDLPKNIESYYQETGRAGRDGDPSHCMLLYSRGDAARLRRFASQIEDPVERERSLQLLRGMDRFAAVPRCRRTALLEYFGERYAHDHCDACDVCTGQFETVDATRDAQIVLSAIARSGERFGAVHICDIVAGASTEKISRFRHDALKTYGAGKGLSKSHWRGVLDALLSSEIVTHAEDGYAVPKLSAAAWEIIRGGRTFERQQDTRIEPERDRRRPVIDDAAISNHALLEHLRVLRKELADAADVPPYVIFAERTLRLIAAQMPADMAALGRLHGIGAYKLEQYGEAFTELVRRYLAEHPKAGNLQTRVVEAEHESGRRLSATFQQTLELLRKGMAPAEIARRREITISTVESHIAKLIEMGVEIDWREFVPSETEAHLRPLFETHGLDNLTPLVEAAGGRASYGQARILRAALISERSKLPKSPC